MESQTDMLDFVAEIDHDVRVVNDFKPGYRTGQGDVNIYMLSGRTDLNSIVQDRVELQKRLNKNPFWTDFRFGTLGERTNNLQLVPGTSIGSRHEVSETDRSIVEVYAPSKDASPLEGPVVVAKARFQVVHPEHANHELPEGTYQIVYQRDFAKEEAARVMD